MTDQSSPRHSLTHLVALGVIVLASCDGPTEMEPSLGPDGGDLTFSGGAVRLEFPPGAHAGPLFVTVTPTDPQPSHEHLISGTTFRFGPSDAEFERSVRLTVRYDPREVPTGVPEGSLRLHQAVGAGWEPVESGSVDPQRNLVSGSIRRFGLYGVVAQVPDAGDLSVRVSTSGEDVDPDGYDVLVDGSLLGAIDVEGEIILESLPAGAHEVRLSDVSANCIVQGQNPRTITVANGDIRSTSFQVDCMPTTAELAVATHTTGELPDTDGYVATVSGGDPKPIGSNDEVVFPALSAGPHEVRLTDVASNCVVTSPNPRTVSMESGSRLSTRFEIVCAVPTANLRVETHTAGADIDPDGYWITLEGGEPRPIGRNDEISFSGLSSGSYTLELTGIATNCVVTSPNPRTVSVDVGFNASTRFDIECEERTGNLWVQTSTTGRDLGSHRYSVSVDGEVHRLAEPNDQILFERLAEGPHRVTISDIPPECGVEDGDSADVYVLAESDTGVHFRVGCEPPPVPPRSIAALGCSNTAGHTVGYDERSDLDLLVRLSVTEVSGETLPRWASNSKGWESVESREPAGGYEAAWVQICLLTDEHDGEMTELHQTQITSVVERLADQFQIPSSRVFISPLNYFASGTVCYLTGPEGPEVAAAIADWAAGSLGVRRGPNTGPLGPSQLQEDQCHLNAAGRWFVGQQLAEFFDQGAAF